MCTTIVFVLLCCCTMARCITNDYTANITDAIEKQHKVDKIKKDLYAILETNIRQNSVKVTLDDFAWGIFNGNKGHLHGIGDFNLVNNNTIVSAQRRKMNISFETTVPKLRATWEKSSCMGFSCAMTIELHNAVFVLRMVFDADECLIDHIIYLKKYEYARCHADYDYRMPMSTRLVETTVKLMAHALNTKPFEKIVKDNVNYALLQLALFSSKDIRELCKAYQDI